MDRWSLHILLAPLGLTKPSGDRKSTRLNSSHGSISYAVFCLKKNKILQLHLAEVSCLGGPMGRKEHNIKKSQALLHLKDRIRNSVFFFFKDHGNPRISHSFPTGPSTI